jgi:hypothetical protein
MPTSYSCSTGYGSKQSERPRQTGSRKAARHQRQLLAVKHHPPDRCGRPLYCTLRTSGLELPVCVLLLPVDSQPRTPARDPQLSFPL